MKTTLTDVMKALPDYEDLDKLSNDIADLMYEKMLAENTIKEKEADVFRKAFTDSTYFIGGKPAPVSYIENTYKFGGFSGEILGDREHLALVISNLERAKMKFSLYKDMLDVWRTLSANSRAASLD